MVRITLVNKMRAVTESPYFEDFFNEVTSDLELLFSCPQESVDSFRLILDVSLDPQNAVVLFDSTRPLSEQVICAYFASHRGEAYDCGAVLADEDALGDEWLTVESVLKQLRERFDTLKR